MRNLAEINLMQRKRTVAANEKRRDRDRGEKLPSMRKVRRLYNRHISQQHRAKILAHMNAVEMLASGICRELRRKGIKVDSRLVRKVALTHDIFREKTRHEKAAFDFFEKKYHTLATTILLGGVDEIGRMQDGRFEKQIRANGANHSISMENVRIEDLIFHLADARAKENSFVSLEERMNEIIESHERQDKERPGLFAPPETLEWHIKNVRKGFSELQKFQDELKELGIDVEAILRGSQTKAAKPKN